MIIKNTGTSDLSIQELVLKQTTLPPGASMEVDANTVKVKIGDAEITIP